MNPENILSICSSVLNIKECEITGKSRKAEVVIARHIYCYVSKYKTNLPLKHIGYVINRDHSSIIHGIKSIDNYLSIRYKEVVKKYNLVIDKIEENNYNSLIVQDVNLLKLTKNYKNSFLNL